MASATEKDWVLPALVPSKDLKSKDLEECVYWLLDGMGAKDLEWRTGGAGDGASDGGRDLEAKFYVSNSDGEIEPQLWWVECKGRKGTLEADAVKSALNNALARKDLAWIVIATNTQFSNPTRDWVREWQERHPLPKVALWDHVTLERYLSEHPQVVLRLFSEALSHDGKMRAMGSRFWNKLEYVDPKLLDALWQRREEEPIDGMALFAAIVNEFAHGDITRRPWGGALAAVSVLGLLEIGLQNMTYLSIRAHRAGVEMRPIIRTIVYLLLIVLEHIPAKTVTTIVEDLIYRGQKDEWPDYVREMLILPVARQLHSEMHDICTADCRRMMGLRRRTLSEDKDELETYWLRFEPDGLSEERVTRYAWIEATREPCVVGFKTDEKRSCPLVRFEPKIDNVGDLLRIAKKVAAFRKKQAPKKRAADTRAAELRTKGARARIKAKTPGEA
jgi:hypothetical protein